MPSIWLAEMLSGRLDRARGESLQRQLYFLIREAILARRIAPGRKLPSTRQLAEDLALGRNTVAGAFEQLVAEGYVVSRVGAGSFVADTLPDHYLEAASAATPAPATSLRLSRRAQLVLSGTDIARTETGTAFLPGLPELRQFPHKDWQRLLAKHWRGARLADLDYGRGGGLPALKQAVAEYLGVVRAVRCRPEQIVITAGAQQGLELALRLVTDPGDAAVIEDPGYLGARSVMQANGLELYPVPVDEEGLDLDGVPWAARPRLLYVTPSHQYPSGAVMSLTRRRALLALAERHDSYIVEDDYDSEFRYSGSPLASLQGLDGGGRVFYLGTFSKILFPALRLGYLVLPEPLAEAGARLLRRVHHEGHQTHQAALAEFIREGRLTAHIRRMRLLYAERQQVLREAWTRHIGEDLPLSGGEAGMHLTARLPAGLDDLALSRLGAARGLNLRPLSLYGLNATPSGLVLGYAGVEQQEIQRATTVLAALLASVWR
ncbi:MAG: PLP-dependent aminotransferase family protein [Gammaproteobacteria bacterium]|nr:PLP-dependent aminotransferase family protein [Gammaproteobacteria bacterium]